MTTRDAHALREDFRRDGYVRLPGFLSTAEVDAWRAGVERLIRDRLDSLPREHVFFENRNDPATLKQIQQLGEHDELFGEAQRRGRPRELAERLLEGGVVPKNVQYFNKPPGIGRATPPHQDGHYFMLAPCEAVTMWIALDSVDEGNGCVRYIPGSHRGGMRPHGRTDTLGFSQGICDFGTADDREREVAIPAEPGDLLVHHALTIHRADRNRSPDRTRRAIGFIYYSERAMEDSAAHAAYQDRLKREMLESGRI